jgi:hypothetical protein
MVNFCEEISDFRLYSARFLPREFNLISENFNSVNQKLNTFVFRPFATGNVLDRLPWRVRVKGRSGRFKRDVVVLEDIEFTSEKTKVCDC